eukprot:TRINITY_DN14874_c1_g2_i4.p1 TRINITY_DN14874_c1_g2~~TRINITY_DN14874_c1_g2_i4.p1  ORF type:complete len:361 (+),score=37.11 TRINITY_DN14874_c1_g2_i4:46-1128(+)
MASFAFAVRACVCVCVHMCALLTSSYRLRSDDGENSTSCSSFSDILQFNEFIESVADHALECARGSLMLQVDCEEFRPDHLATLHSLLEIEREGGEAQLVRRSEPTDSPRSIAVVSMCYSADQQSPYFTQICEVAHRNFHEYSEHHGYRLFFHDKPFPSCVGCAGRSPAWHKIRALQDAMQQDGVNFVFWMDSDSLFMNLDKNLTDVLPSDGKEMAIVGDHNAFLNSGHLVLRNSEWSKSLLEEAWSTYPPPQPDCWWEQSALLYILGGRRPECREAVNVKDCNNAGPSFLPQVEVKKQSSMNSYITSFHEGDLVLHFAGQPDKSALMVTYAEHAGFHASLLQTVWGSSTAKNVRNCFEK